MDVAPAYMSCLNCGEMCEVWSEDGSYKCEKCGTQQQIPIQEECANCHKLTTKDKLGSCQMCGYNGEGAASLDFDDVFEERVVEGLIIRAVEKRSFIEALSLIHNTVEWYLIMRVRDFSRDCLKEEFSYEKLFAYLRSVSSQAKMGSDTFSFKLMMCYLLGLIEVGFFERIYEFNRKRNDAIHKLLTLEKARDLDAEAREELAKSNDAVEAFKKMKEIDDIGDGYLDILDAAKLGRRIQLELSPNSFSEKEIKEIMEKFELSEEEKANDKYLRKS